METDKVTQAVYDRLAGDPVLTDLLAEYHGEPAIFTDDPPPGDAELPYIITSGFVSGATDVPESTKTVSGVQFLRDVRCYVTRPAQSMRDAEVMAARVFELFHRKALAIEGWHTVRVNATQPFVGAAEDEAYGLIVALTMRLQEGFEQ